MSDTKRVGIQVLPPASATVPGYVTTGTQTFAGNKTFTGSVTASNLSGTNSGTNTGDVTIAAPAAATDNGLSLSAQALSSTPADATHPGHVTTGAQTFAGVKTFADGIALPDWIEPALLNSWVNYGSGYAPASYYKDAMGIVHLRGLIKDGAAAIAYTLPAGYRPAYPSIFSCVSNWAFGSIKVFANGDVEPTNGSTTFYSLEGITFRAEA